jgi:hypothetical protein
LEKALLLTGNQDTNVVVHRQAIRAEDPAHTALPQPILGDALQSSKDGLVVYRLEQAEIAGLVTMGCEMEVIDLRADAPDWYAVTPCQPETGLAMVKERVPLPVEQPMHVATQRRDPVRIVAMKAIGQVDKAGATTPAAKRDYLDAASSRWIPFARGARVDRIRLGGSRQSCATAVHQH